MGRRGTGIAGGAGEVTPIGNFDEGQTAVLFMIGTDAAVVRTAINRFRVRLTGIFACFVVIPDLFVIINIGGDHDFLKAMFLAGLGKVCFSRFEDDLGADLLMAHDAEADRMVVIDIIPFIFHMVNYAPF